MDSRQRNLLREHIPVMSLDLVVDWLEKYRVALTITRRRNSKMGDYRPPLKKSYHRISVNGDLHPLAFLVTLVHEMAHLVIWEQYGRKARPHGEEWKKQFRLMLSEVMRTGTFEGDLEKIVQQFIEGMISYRSYNIQFERKIHEMCADSSDVLLSEIAVHSKFSLHNGREFEKLEKLRTRYRCREVQTGRLYLISGLAKVRLQSYEG